MYSTWLKTPSRYIFFPLWDVYDRSNKLREWRRLHKHEREPLPMKRSEQLAKLIFIAEEARVHVPFYRQRGTEPVTSFESLKSWPIVTKEDIRRAGDAFLSDLFPKSSLIEAKTGGSTGTALRVYFDKDCQEKRNAAALYCDEWSGWRFGEAVGALWGNPPSIPFLKPWVRNTFLERLLYLDTVTMSDSAMAEFLARIEKHRIAFLFGHAHSIYVLAAYIQKNNLKAPAIKGIVSTSMMLIPSERKVIKDVFNCTVIDRYGCEEVGLIGCQCEREEGFHLNIDHLYVEFLRPDGSAAEAGEEGQLVITDLSNRGMPLIRYAVGDMAVRSKERCACGRTWPLMKKVTGRVADFLVKNDGSLVAGVSLVERTLTAIPGMAQMQIVQEDVNKFTLNVVADGRDPREIQNALLSEMKVVFGQEPSMDVRFLPSLPQERNGKYRFAICKVPNRYQGAAV